MTRREFIGLVGAGIGGTLLAGSSAWAAFDLPPDELQRWRREVMEPARPRVYLSGKHNDARMHLGGIGTGNFEIGADGQLTTWQLFNTLRDGQVPFYFVARAGNAARILQTARGPDWPRIKRIEMTGEYPQATLRFWDDELPVQIELEAFSPFAPLNAKLSSIPVAFFHFRVHNPTDQAQTVSLGAMLANPVGYDAKGEIHGISHPNFGGNVNEVFREGQAAGLFMRAEAGREPTLDRPLCIYVPERLREIKMVSHDRPAQLKLELFGRESFPAKEVTEPAQAILWLAETGMETSASFLHSALELTRTGATLVFSGATMPLLNAYAAATGGKPLAEVSLRPDVLFEDFENGYGNWRVEGQAFGQEPAHGTLPNQQRVSGFVGAGLVNSFLHGDDSTGKLTSRDFIIERKFIRFLVGGGSYATTQIRLIINGKTVRATSGRDNERLEPAFWDVQDFPGQTAHIEIVDEQAGGWGHINVDQIVFCDWPGNRALLDTLDALLPASFSAVRQQPPAPDGQRVVSFQKRSLRPDAKESRAANGLAVFTRPVGKGKAALVAGQILDPGHINSPRARQAAFAVLCESAGAHYTELEGQSSKAPGFGTLVIATTGPSVTGLVGFEDWAGAWAQFSAQGRFPELASAKPGSPTAPGQTVNAALATTISVPAGGTVEAPFFFAWHYPNSYYEQTGEWIGCHYATRWPDARAVLRDVVANHDRWRQQTELYLKTFYDSTLPYWLLDCLTANSGITRHIGVVFQIADGDVYGWEGSNGCCAPTCTHVWGYEQSLARLFPNLEKEMRRIDFAHQQNPDGGINNRTLVPSPPHPTGEHPFTDGHASCLLKAYREALNSTDDSFFKTYRPHVKRAVEYLIHRDAEVAGGQPAGVLQDDQWNTYDEALHGVTTFISGYYLAALRAGEEWARRMSDAATANRFHEIFVRGQKKLIELCWNGEYFQQHLPDYSKRRGEVGPGCMSDQLLGQWWAHQLGLGYILPKDKVVSALRAIFKYNWKSDLTGWRHSPRAFAGAKDKGLIVCTWPKGGRPANVMLYSDEVWTGIEHHVGAHLIYEGLVEEGFCIVKGARDRYDGVPRPPIRRNPWSEIECGGHYARAMSSWSLLLALSGYEYDGPRGRLGFNPRHEPDNFKCFFSAPNGWGSFAQTVAPGSQTGVIAVKSGTLAVHTLRLGLARNWTPVKAVASIGGRLKPARLQVTDGFAELRFASGELNLNEGDELRITLS